MEATAAECNTSWCRCEAVRCLRVLFEEFSYFRYGWLVRMV